MVCSRSRPSVFSTLLFLDDSRLSRPRTRTATVLEEPPAASALAFAATLRLRLRIASQAGLLSRFTVGPPNGHGLLLVGSRVTPSPAGTGVTDSEVSQAQVQVSCSRASWGSGPGGRRPIKPTHERAFTMQRTSLTQPTRSLTTLIMKATGTVISPSRSESGLCQCRGNSK